MNRAESLDDIFKDITNALRENDRALGKSKDGNYVIVRTTVTHIKPVAYYEAVLAGSAPEEEVVAKATTARFIGQLRVRSL